MSGVLRPLAGADAAAAAALLRAAFADQECVTDPPSSALRETPRSVAAKLAEGGGAAIVSGGRIVALILWAEQEGGLYLGRLAVLRPWRGRGLARRLIAAGEAEARRRGLVRVHASARLALPGNRRLFAACGYRETTRHTHPGYAAPTFVTLEKHLDR